MPQWNVSAPLDFTPVLPQQPQSGAEDEAWQRPLVMWLRWNDAYQRINEQIYAQRHDPGTVESLLAQLDVLRNQAVEATEAALSNFGP